MKEVFKDLITTLAYQRFQCFYETMLSCSFKCTKKKKKSQKVKTQKDKKGSRIFKSKCSLCNSNKSRFIKQPEASGILNS